VDEFVDVVCDVGVFVVCEILGGVEEYWVDFVWLREYGV